MVSCVATIIFSWSNFIGFRLKYSLFIFADDIFQLFKVPQSWKHNKSRFLWYCDRNRVTSSIWTNELVLACFHIAMLLQTVTRDAVTKKSLPTSRNKNTRTYRVLPYRPRVLTFPFKHSNRLSLLSLFDQTFRLELVARAFHISRSRHCTS